MTSVAQRHATRGFAHAASLAVFAPLFSVLVSCGVSRPTVTAAPRVRPNVTELRAGVSHVDITPPPGLSLFGHGSESRVARGTLGRLMCQAIVAESADEHAVLVTCDLTAVPSELVTAVARHLTEMRVPIADNRVFVMASHTHAGPAHYFPEHGFCGAMTSRLVGYDPAVLEWIALRIATAVREASTRTEPVEVRSGQREVPGLTVNRSFSAYLRNVPQEPVQADGGSRAADAVPKTLSVIRFDRLDGSPLAALSVFGIHNTAIGNHNDLYHADLFGYARRALTRMVAPGPAPVNSPVVHSKVSQLTPIAPRHVQTAHPPVVFALANGAEGDVSPNVDERTAREAQRIGEALAHHIHQLWTDLAATPASRELLVATRTLHLPDAAVNACGVERLCSHGELGVAAGGGAEDGPSGMRIIPVFNEGSRTSEPIGCHGNKLILVPPFHRPGSDPFFFPTYASAATLQLGKMVLATVPFEITTRAASRLVSRVSKHVAGDVAIAVVGLTNGYLMYVTTEEEYALQHYEGASNLYGPHASAFWTHQLGCLARWMSPLGSRGRGWLDECGLGQAPVDARVEVPVDPEPVHRMPSDPDVVGNILNARLEPEPADNEGDRAVQLDFWGPAPGYARSRHRFRAEVHCTRGDAFVGCAGAGSSSLRADDTDGTVSVRALGIQDGNQHRWRVTWTPDSDALDGGLCQPHRFVIHAHEMLVSDTFEPIPHDGCVRWRQRCQLPKGGLDAKP